MHFASTTRRKNGGTTCHPRYCDASMNIQTNIKHVRLSFSILERNTQIPHVTSAIHITTALVPGAMTGLSDLSPSSGGNAVGLLTSHSLWRGCACEAPRCHWPTGTGRPRCGPLTEMALIEPPLPAPPLDNTCWHRQAHLARTAPAIIELVCVPVPVPAAGCPRL